MGFVELFGTIWPQLLMALGVVLTVKVVHWIIKLYSKR